MTVGSSGSGAADTVRPAQVPLNGTWSSAGAGAAAASTTAAARTGRINADRRTAGLPSVRVRAGAGAASPPYPHGPGGGGQDLGIIFRGRGRRAGGRQVADEFLEVGAVGEPL